MAGNISNVQVSLSLNQSSVSKVESQVAAAIAKIERLSSGGGILLKSYSAPLGRISGHVDEFTKSLEASNARVIAFGASAGAIFLVQQALRETVLAAADVEKKLQDISVILGISGSKLSAFGDALFEISKKTGQSFDAVSVSALELSRQGLSVEQTLLRTRDALILSRLSGLDVVSSTEAITAALNTFNKTGLDSTILINKLANVDASFAVSSADLAEAIKRVGSSAGDAGVGLDQLIAIVTSAQQTTARGGSVIGNSLKTIFTRIQRPEVLNDLEAFGVAVKDASGESLSAIQILKNFADVYDSLSPAQKSLTSELLGGVYQINILKAAVGDLGKEYSIYDRALGVSVGSTDQAIQRNNDLNVTLSALFNETSNNAKKFASSFGKSAFEPAIRSVLTFSNDVFSAFAEKNPDDIGAKVGKGIVNGIGKFISTSGIALIGFVGAKLFTNFGKFAINAVSSFTGMNSETQKQQELQQMIQNILIKNPEIIDAAKSSSSGLLDIEKEILRVVEQRNMILQESERLSRSLATSISPSLTKKSKGGFSSGFIPNFNLRDQEISGALQGGYKPGKVVPSPVGGVMNTAEQVKYVSGFTQPFINPPKDSEAGREHKKNAIRQTGINPYARGFVPKVESINIAEKPFHVKDGDTVTADATIKAVRDFRLSGIDAAEGNQYLGPEATNYAQEKVGDYKQFSETVNKNGRAAYDRLEFINGKLARGLVQTGLGVPDLRYTESYKGDVERAKAQEKGIWSKEHMTKEGEYTHPKAIQYIEQLGIQGEIDKELENQSLNKGEKEEIQKKGRRRQGGRVTNEKGGRKAQLTEGQYSSGFIPNFERAFTRKGEALTPEPAMGDENQLTPTFRKIYKDQLANKITFLDFDETLIHTRGDAEYAKASTSEAKSKVLQDFFTNPGRINDIRSSRLTPFGSDLKARIDANQIRPDLLGIMTASDKTAGMPEYINQTWKIPMDEIHQRYNNKTGTKAVKMAELRAAGKLGKGPAVGRLVDDLAIATGFVPNSTKAAPAKKPTVNYTNLLKDNPNLEVFTYRYLENGNLVGPKQISQNAQGYGEKYEAVLKSGGLQRLGFSNIEDLTTRFPNSPADFFATKSHPYLLDAKVGWNDSKVSAMAQKLKTMNDFRKSQAFSDFFIKEKKYKEEDFNKIKMGIVFGNAQDRDTRPGAFLRQMNEAKIPLGGDTKFANTDAGDFKVQRTPFSEGFIPNFNSFSEEEKSARSLGAANPTAHLERGTIGGKPFVMNDRETEVPGFGKNGDSLVLPNYGQVGRDRRKELTRSSGFVPNFGKKRLINQEGGASDGQREKLTEMFASVTREEPIGASALAFEMLEGNRGTPWVDQALADFETFKNHRQSDASGAPLDMNDPENVAFLRGQWGSRYFKKKIGKKGIFDRGHLSNPGTRPTAAGGFVPNFSALSTIRKALPEFPSLTYGGGSLQLGELSAYQLQQLPLKKTVSDELSKLGVQSVSGFSSPTASKALKTVPTGLTVSEKGHGNYYQRLAPLPAFVGESANEVMAQSALGILPENKAKLTRDGKINVGEDHADLQGDYPLEIYRDRIKSLVPESQIPANLREVLKTKAPGGRVEYAPKGGKAYESAQDTINKNPKLIADVRRKEEEKRLRGYSRGFVPNFNSFSEEEKSARRLGASNPTAHFGKGTIGGKPFIMNDRETEVPSFGKNGDSLVLPNYGQVGKDRRKELTESSGFVPNFLSRGQEATNILSGIPEKVLGVGRGATAEQIKTAHRRLIIENHPDKNLNSQELANKYSAKINSAYEELKGGSINSGDNQFSRAANEMSKVDKEARKKEARDKIINRYMFDNNRSVKGLVDLREFSLDADIGKAYLRSILSNASKTGFPAARSSREYASLLSRVGGEESKLSLDSFIQNFLKTHPDFNKMFNRGFVPNFASERLFGKTRRPKDAPKSKSGSSKDFSEGFIPNFNREALLEAISRENKAGIPLKNIKVETDKSLSGPQNPLGLGVYNNLQERNLKEGIKFSKQAGISPKTKGSSQGFVPNFVDSMDLLTFVTVVGSLRLAFNELRDSTLHLSDEKRKETKDKIEELRKKPEKEKEEISKKRSEIKNQYDKQRQALRFAEGERDKRLKKVGWNDKTTDAKKGKDREDAERELGVRISAEKMAQNNQAEKRLTGDLQSQKNAESQLINAEVERKAAQELIKNQKKADLAVKEAIEEAKELEERRLEKNLTYRKAREDEKEIDDKAPDREKEISAIEEAQKLWGSKGRFMQNIGKMGAIASVAAPIVGSTISQVMGEATTEGEAKTKAGVEGFSSAAGLAGTGMQMGAAFGIPGIIAGGVIGGLIGVTKALSGINEAAAQFKIDQVSTQLEAVNEKTQKVTQGFQSFMDASEKLKVAFESTEVQDPKNIVRIQDQLAKSMQGIPEEFRDKFLGSLHNVEKMKEIFSDITENLNSEKQDLESSKSMYELQKKEATGVFDKTIFEESNSKKLMPGARSMIGSAINRAEMNKKVKEQGFNLDDLTRQNVEEKAKGILGESVTGFLAQLKDFEDFNVYKKYLKEFFDEAKTGAEKVEIAAKLSKITADENIAYKKRTDVSKEKISLLTSSYNSVMESGSKRIQGSQKLSRQADSFLLERKSTETKGSLDLSKAFLSEQRAADESSKIKIQEINIKALEDLKDADDEFKKAGFEKLLEPMKMAIEKASASRDLLDKNDVNEGPERRNAENLLKYTQEFNKNLLLAQGRGEDPNDFIERNREDLLKNFKEADVKNPELQVQAIVNSLANSKEEFNQKQNEIIQKLQQQIDIEKIQAANQKLLIDQQRKIQAFGGASDFLAKTGDYGHSSSFDKLVEILNLRNASRLEDSPRKELDFAKANAQLLDVIVKDLGVNASGNANLQPLIQGAFEQRSSDLEASIRMVNKLLTNVDRAPIVSEENVKSTADDIAKSQIAAQFKVENMTDDVAKLRANSEELNMLTSLQSLSLEGAIDKSFKEALKSVGFDRLSGNEISEANRIGGNQMGVAEQVGENLSRILREKLRQERDLDIENKIKKVEGQLPGGSLKAYNAGQETAEKKAEYSRNNAPEIPQDLILKQRVLDTLNGGRGTRDEVNRRHEFIFKNIRKISEYLPGDGKEAAKGSSQNLDHLRKKARDPRLEEISKERNAKESEHKKLEFQAQHDWSDWTEKTEMDLGKLEKIIATEMDLGKLEKIIADLNTEEKDLIEKEKQNWANILEAGRYVKNKEEFLPQGNLFQKALFYSGIPAWIETLEIAGRGRGKMSDEEYFGRIGQKENEASNEIVHRKNERIKAGQEPPRPTEETKRLLDELRVLGEQKAGTKSPNMDKNFERVPRPKPDSSKYAAETYIGPDLGFLSSEIKKKFESIKDLEETLSEINEELKVAHGGSPEEDNLNKLKSIVAKQITNLNSIHEAMSFNPKTFDSSSKSLSAAEGAAEDLASAAESSLSRAFNNLKEVFKKVRIESTKFDLSPEELLKNLQGSISLYDNLLGQDEGGKDGIKKQIAAAAKRQRKALGEAKFKNLDRPKLEASVEKSFDFAAAAKYSKAKQDYSDAEADANIKEKKAKVSNLGEDRQEAAKAREHADKTKKELVNIKRPAFYSESSGGLGGHEMLRAQVLSIVKNLTSEDIAESEGLSNEDLGKKFFGEVEGAEEMGRQLREMFTKYSRVPSRAEVIKLKGDTIIENNEISLRLAKESLEENLELFKRGAIDSDALRAKIRSANEDAMKKGVDEKDRYGAENLKNTIKGEFTYTQENRFKDLDNLAKQFSQNLSSGISGAMSEAIMGTKSLKAAFADMFGSIAEMISRQILEMGVKSAMNSVFEFKQGGLIKGYSTGGEVFGGSGTKDDVPAYLSRGEYVIKKQSVNKYGVDYLNSLNRMELNERASGGSSSKSPDPDPDSGKESRINIGKDFADFNLKNDYVYDDMKKPTKGEYQVDRLLSAYALTSDSNPENARKFEKANNLDQYLKEKKDHQELYDKSVKDWRKQQRARTLGNMAQTAIGLGSIASTGGFSKKASGGPIYKDNIPTMLTGGEFVVRKDAVDKYGSKFLDRLNEGSVQGFSEGGLVGTSPPVKEMSERGEPSSTQSNNVSIVINIDSSGSVQSSNRGGISQEDGRLFAEEIKASVLSTIIQQKRVGGLLYKGNQ